MVLLHELYDRWAAEEPNGTAVQFVNGTGPDKEILKFSVSEVVKQSKQIAVALERRVLAAASSNRGRKTIADRLVAINVTRISSVLNEFKNWP